MAQKILNGVHISGTTQLDFMPTHESEGIIKLGRYDSNTSRYHNIKSYVSSTEASNYLKFSLHNGTTNTVVDVLTLNGNKNATFTGTLQVDGSNVGIGGAAANASYGSVGTKLDMKGGADSLIILRGAAGGSGADAYVASEYGLYSYNGEFMLTRTNQSGWWASPDFKLSGGNATFAGTVNVKTDKVQIDQDGTYGSGYGVVGFGGKANGYNRVFGNTGTSDGLFLASATGRGVFIRVNGAGTDTHSFGSNGYVGMGIASNNNQRLTLAQADANGSHLKMNNSRSGGGYWVVGVGDTNSNSSIVDPGGLFFYNGSTKLKLDSSGNATFAGSINVNTNGLIKYEENTDVDSSAAEAVASVVHGTHTAAFFDYVIKKGDNVRAGIVTACHDGTNVEYAETSTVDLGDTSDVTLSVDISGIYMRLIATTTSNDWSVKSLIRAI